ncbi:type VI secretion system protein TssA [uncultured Tateyamaria sp.]|uniref:type VI secretion system protein TssA n=1 Tax=uncultured Tateyamaria sp. TaxID=455651 RepID=UPI0026172F01|nr:type VI secretion system protein TssA [uncultured Tateyamaria sp.]
MDIDALLQSHGDDAPSGEDLEYDPVFTELEIAATHGEERQMGDDILPPEDPDYKEVAAKAEEILGRSHDLRAGIFLAEAQLRLKGFPGFSDAINYVARCLDEYWGSCHPQLDADDDDDPTMRINAILTLVDDARILRGVRRAPLTQSRTFGAISLREISVADGESTPTSDMDNVPDQGQVQAAFQDTDEEVLKGISEAVAKSLVDVTAISAKFDEMTPGQGPDLDPLIKLLKKASNKIANALGEPEGDAGGDDAGDGDAGDGSAPAGRPAGGGGTGAINNPTDVQNALDRIISYYERAEPSSPVPLLLTRAKKLVGADFMTIVRDMAYDSVDRVNMIGGISDDE